MADYYPLIARAVERLSENNPEMRSSVYERARSALIDQLRTLDPPLSEADIARERIALDEAIARVEADFTDPPIEIDAEPEPPPEPDPPPLARPVLAPPAPPEPEPFPEPAEELRAIPLPPPPLRLAPPTPEQDAPAFLREGRDDDEGPEEQEHAPAPPPAVRPRVESRAPRIRSEGRGRMLILGSILVLVVGVIAYLAWIWRDQPDTAQVQPPVATAPQPAEGAKFNERVGGGPPTPPAGAARSEIGVAQRAVLYEEDATNPRAPPKASVGQVTWRLDAVNAGQGQPLETVVRAQVDIAEAGLKMTLLIRRNLDTTLPASHTAEIAFVTKAGESGRAIRDVGLLQFKEEFSTRGTPVAGQRITLGENLFVIGLLSSDLQRNADLMKRGWIDLPLLMASGQRAVLTFEKGAPGEQVMNDAWKQWQPQ